MNPATVLFVHLEELASVLNDATRQALGASVSVFSSLQTLVIRKCGLHTVRAVPCVRACPRVRADASAQKPITCLLAAVLTTCSHICGCPLLLLPACARAHAVVAYCCLPPLTVQLDAFVLPSLLRCDLSYNEIVSLGTLERFARHSLELVHLDVSSNPLLVTPEWRVSSFCHRAQ
jgi:hypothetical protein